MIRANNKYPKGIIDVPDDEGQHLIDSGAAVPVKDEEPNN